MLPLNAWSRDAWSRDAWSRDQTLRTDLTEILN